MAYSTRDVIVRTEDPEAAAAFYGEILGFTRTDYADMIGFDTGSFTLYVERGAPHGPVFDFIVGSLEGAKAQLVAEGCTVVEEDPSVPRCYVRDPFGLVFNLEESGEEVAG